MDKKSFIRWKQRDIHEKREVRKQELLAYKAELVANAALEPMLNEVRSYLLDADFTQHAG